MSISPISLTLNIAFYGSNLAYEKLVSLFFHSLTHLLERVLSVYNVPAIRVGTRITGLTETH